MSIPANIWILKAAKTSRTRNPTLLPKYLNALSPNWWNSKRITLLGSKQENVLIWCKHTLWLGKITIMSQPKWLGPRRNDYRMEFFMRVAIGIKWNGIQFLGLTPSMGWKNPSFFFQIKPNPADIFRFYWVFAGFRANRHSLHCQCGQGDNKTTITTWVLLTSA